MLAIEETVSCDKYSTAYPLFFSALTHTEFTNEQIMCREESIKPAIGNLNPFRSVTHLTVNYESVGKHKPNLSQEGS